MKKTAFADPARQPRRSRVRTLAPFAVPAAALVLLPKCPVCLAVWLTLFAGTTVSAATAGAFRTTLVLLSLGSVITGIVAYFWSLRVRESRAPARCPLSCPHE